MSKQITFQYKGKEYVLEYTRRTVAQMERNGFVAGDVRDKPVTTLPALFSGAFLAHHKFMKQELIDEIYDSIVHKDELIAKLVEMYNEPIAALVEDPAENEGNVTWTASW